MITPKFQRGFNPISKQGFLPDLKFNLLKFGFIRFLAQSALLRYQIHQFSSRFDPLIFCLTNRCSKSILIWALTFEGYYS